MRVHVGARAYGRQKDRDLRQKETGRESSSASERESGVGGVRRGKREWREETGRPDGTKEGERSHGP